MHPMMGSGTVRAGNIYGPQRGAAAPVNGNVTAPAATGGGGLADLLNDAGEFGTRATGLALPALLAMGLLSMVLFRYYD